MNERNPGVESYGQFRVEQTSFCISTDLGWNQLKGCRKWCEYSKCFCRYPTYVESPIFSDDSPGIDFPSFLSLWILLGKQHEGLNYGVKTRAGRWDMREYGIYIQGRREGKCYYNCSNFSNSHSRSRIWVRNRGNGRIMLSFGSKKILQNFVSSPTFYGRLIMVNNFQVYRMRAFPENRTEEDNQMTLSNLEFTVGSSHQSFFFLLRFIMARRQIRWLKQNE